MNKAIKNTVTVAAVAFAIAIAPALLPAQATNEQPFDHSNCQYPNRLTNPANGCDNSDPACPIQKDGSEDCPSTPETAQEQPEALVGPAPTHPYLETMPVPSCSE